MSVVAYVLVWWLPALHDDSATSRGPNQMMPLNDCIDFDTNIHLFCLSYFFFLLRSPSIYFDYLMSSEINDYIIFQ